MDLSNNDFCKLPDLNLHNLDTLILDQVYLTDIAQAANFYLPLLQTLNLTGKIDTEIK